MKRLLLIWMATVLAVSLNAAPSVAQDDMRIVSVHFPPGSTGTTINGRVTGRETVLHTLGAEAGQTMTIALSSNSATYFNLYAPGSGPGDEALAIGELQPQTNKYSGVLPTSGEYGISVFLFRNAARRGETADFTLDISITGETGDVVKGDFADGLQGGPDYWAVRTRGGALNLRQSASPAATIVVRLANGTPLRNLGCRMAEGRRWCRFTTLSDPGFEGWAAGEFLIEGSGQGAAMQLPDAIPIPSGGSDALVPGTEFNATGPIDCMRGQDGPTQSCTFGVKREGNGNGSVTVTFPDGAGRVIFFEKGNAVSYDQSQADAGATMTVSRDGDNSIVFIGQAQTCRSPSEPFAA
ncbi:hypothetical protein [Primorskyibacter sp. 2E233]|uniref:hypothetical protein n=1 Tax=Primorskyibacter sp. 2E233 TaxID=3413431 RepID=UPI003BEF9292